MLGVNFSNAALQRAAQLREDKAVAPFLWRHPSGESLDLFPPVKSRTATETSTK